MKVKSILFISLFLLAGCGQKAVAPKVIEPAKINPENPGFTSGETEMPVATSTDVEINGIATPPPPPPPSLQ